MTADSFPSDRSVASEAAAANIIKRVKDILDYDPETGIFTWRVARGGMKPGAKAGGRNPGGYTTVSIDSKSVYLHRLAWLLVYGAWPNIIDHINGVRDDNRIANLRDVSGTENQQNRRSPPRSKKSGAPLGVTRNNRKWRATISMNNKNVALGTYKTQREAHEAYLAAKRELHKGCTI